MLAPLIAAAVTAALAVGFAAGVMFGLARRPLQGRPAPGGRFGVPLSGPAGGACPAATSQAAFFETRISSLYLTTKEA